jgi:protein-tyrosine phosphatase
MGLFDLHCHLLPGIDDSKVPEDGLESVLEVYCECGFSGLAFTPHVFNPYVTTKVAAIRGVWQKAEALCKGLGLKAYLGSELYVGAQAELKGIPIAGKYLLVEFSTSLPPPGVTERLLRVKSEGLVPLIAHVERYAWLSPDGPVCGAWKKMGALLQVNVGGVQDGTALPYLEAGIVDVMATDNHGTDVTIPASLMSIVQKWPDVLARMEALGL